MRRVVKLLSRAFHVLLITFGWEQTEQIALSCSPCLGHSCSGILYLKCLYVVFVLLWYTVSFHISLSLASLVRFGVALTYCDTTRLFTQIDEFSYQWQWLGQSIGTVTVAFVCPIDRCHSTQFKHAWTLTRDEDYDELINENPALILVK